MNRKKRKRIPFEFREERNLREQIEQHHKEYFVITADGMLRLVEPYFWIDRR